MNELLQAAVEADPFRWDLAEKGTRADGTWRPAAETAGVPGLVTLQPGTTPHPQKTELVRDSFADLELRGYTTLLNGAWLVRPPSQVPPSVAWSVTDDRAAWLAGWGDALPLPDHPGIRLLARTAHGRVTGGAVATVHGGVVSLAHLFTAGRDLTPVWTGAADLVGTRWPGLPVVSHDSGTGLATALAAGYRQLGPMRVLVHL